MISANSRVIRMWRYSLSFYFDMISSADRELVWWPETCLTILPLSLHCCHTVCGSINPIIYFLYVLTFLCTLKWKTLFPSQYPTIIWTCLIKYINSWFPQHFVWKSISFPQQLRELFVPSLHGDLSDQKGGQSRHPEAHRAQRRGQQSVDSVSPSGRHNQQPSSQIYRVKSSVFVL